MRRDKTKVTGGLEIYIQCVYVGHLIERVGAHLN